MAKRKRKMKISKKAIAGRAAHFRESEHPRGPGGKFKDKGNPGKMKPKSISQNRERVAEITGLFSDVSASQAQVMRQLTRTSALRANYGQGAVIAGVRRNRFIVKIDGVYEIHDGSRVLGIVAGSDINALSRKGLIESRPIGREGYSGKGYFAVSGKRWRAV